MYLADPSADRELRRYRIGRRLVLGILAAVWIAVAAIVAILPILGPAAFAVGFGLLNTAYSVLLLRQMRAAHLRRATAGTVADDRFG